MATWLSAVCVPVASRAARGAFGAAGPDAGHGVLQQRQGRQQEARVSSGSLRRNCSGPGSCASACACGRGAVVPPISLAVLELQGESSSVFPLPCCPEMNLQGEKTASEKKERQKKMKW